MEYNLRTVRLGDDVWEAIQAHEKSANELLRLALGMSPKRVSKKDAHVAALKAQDPLATIVGREDIEHGNMELPSGGSIALSPVPSLNPRISRGPRTDAYRARGIRPKGDKGR